MNITVLFGEVAYISRSRIIDGILESARKDHANVILFTCEGFLFHDLEKYIAGEYTIFNLPAFENYDGVIVDLDSIQNEKIREYLFDNINKSNIPCVSFNQSIAIANQINFDNARGFKELIAHLISDHNVKTIHYISGPLGNRDAIQRLNLLKQTLNENGLSISDDMIYEGDFNFGSGKELAKLYTSTGRKLPDAFVAANDFMAIGLMEELKLAGIRVPDDVIVTGYDNSEIAENTEPRLTTVDRGEFESGVTAYKKLISNINDTEENSLTTIYGRPVIGRSCGCNACSNELSNAVSNAFVNLKINMDQSLDLIKGLSIELSDIDSLDAFVLSLEKYIEKMGMDYFYFCQCGSRESYYAELESMASGKKIRRNMTTYQDTVWCPIAYENGEWNSYPKFSSRLLFPPNAKNRKQDAYYIVMPVHQGDVCIGYSIIGNFHNHMSGRALQHLVLGIDHALGNIRKHDIMTTMLAKINEKWQYDELTKLYNRSGMLYNVGDLIDSANKESMGICVIFFDLDGLKAINDTKGHEAGDLYICSMADVLRNNCEEGDIITRYGGDEYILISKQKSWETSISKLEYISSKIVEPLSASAGCAFERITSLEDLKFLVEEADKQMYEYKKRKKGVLNSNF